MPLKPSSTLVACFLLVLATGTARAQLNTTFADQFEAVLIEGFALSPGQHGQHFLPAAQEASGSVTPALNSLIANNVASFPLNATVAGITFDFSTGEPVAVMESQGPIFAESALTLGAGTFAVGFNATSLSLGRLRGVNLDEMRLTFLHEDADESGLLGDNINESDVVDIFLNLDADAYIYAIFATFGVTSDFDVSIAIPFIDVSLQGATHAVVRSFTFAALGEANHHFGADPTDPILDITEPAYDERAAGVGDIALRFKLHLPTAEVVDTGLLLDVRVPTGDEFNFLGTGTVSARGLLLFSRRIGDFTPHLNLGYDYRRVETDSDEFEFALGFDQKLTQGLTFAFDILGEIDLEKDKALTVLPGSAVIVDRNPTFGNSTIRTVSRSNIPARNYDNTVNVAAGLRFAPTQHFQMVANMLVPLQDGGLRSQVAPTIGFTLTF